MRQTTVSTTDGQGTIRRKKKQGGVIFLFKKASPIPEKRLGCAPLLQLYQALC